MQALSSLDNRTEKNDATPDSDTNTQDNNLLSESTHSSTTWAVNSTEFTPSTFSGSNVLL